MFALTKKKGKNTMFKILMIMSLLLPTVAFAAGKPNKMSKPSPSRTSNTRSEFYGPNGRRIGNTTQSGKTTRYYAPNGKYLGKEVKNPR